jgi:cell division protein ZapA
MGRERLVEIKVFGQTYTVKTDAEEDYIQEVAKYVNEKMDEVLKKTKSVSTLNVAILTALNIADDLLKEKEKRVALLREVDAKSKDLSEKIDIEMGKIGFEKAPIMD